MRTVRIRTFTMLCFFFILSAPWVCYVSAYFVQNRTLDLGNNRAQNESIRQQVSETIRLIGTNAGSWTDPEWQRVLLTELRQTNIDATIRDTAGQDLFRSDSRRRSALKSAESYSMTENGQVVGTVVLYVPNSRALPMMAAFAGLLLAFVIVGFGMRRSILKPLGRMSFAARQIAAGDWEVRLPSSGVTEIAEVRDGFEVMVKGLQQSARKQMELEEERRFVIAAVAHDLRTPLFALRGYLEGIDQGIAQSPDKLAKYLAVCKEKSAQLDRLVEDLFTFTKIEYLEVELNRSAVDLKLVLQKAIDSLSPLARQKQIAITLNHSANDCTVIGDPHLLERAMNNLLDNAVRHTPSHGNIFVQCDKDGRNVTFAIRDTGPGFASEELGRVFEPLYRGESSRNRATGGAGLGLTISRRILRRHGGELIAGNAPDQGALLSGWIPAASACRQDPE